MGRPKKQIDDINLLKMRGEGKFLKEISEEMQISTRTLSRRVASLKYQKGILTKYREIQGLQLTELQARILEMIALKNLEDCSLMELLNAFTVIAKTEKSIRGLESYKVKGLLNHLLCLEKLEKICAQKEK